MAVKKFGKVAVYVLVYVRFRKLFQLSEGEHATSCQGIQIRPLVDTIVQHIFSSQ